MLTEDLSPDALAIAADADRLGLSAHIDQYIGAWAIHEPNLKALVGYAQQINLQLHLEQQATRQPDAASSIANGGAARYQVTRDGIAIISLHGTLTKHVASMSDGTSTVLARRQLRTAAADPDVGAILLHVDSPGGTVSGTHDLAADIRAVGDKKPVHAYGEDLVASAAFWDAAQAARFSTGPTALVGSIGVLHVIHDLSRLADKEGIEVHVVKFGAHKGSGVPGTAITEEQLAKYQELVDSFGADFISAVAAGRRVSEKKAAEWADGSIYKAPEALKMGLIDAVESLDESLANLRSRMSGSSRSNQPRSEAKAKMSDTPTQPAASFQEQLAARRAEIVAACDGAPKSFIDEQLAAGADASTASKAWMAQLLSDREAADKRAEEAEAKQKQPRGADPLDDGPGADDDPSGGDPVAAWEEAVAKEEKGGRSRAKAIATARKKNPQLHCDYVVAANRQAGRPSDRFESMYGS